MEALSKARHLRDYFEKQAQEGQGHVEFYQLKSKGRHRERELKGWQNHVDCCVDTIEILDKYINSQENG